MVTNFFGPRMSGAEGRSRTDTGSPPPAFEDQRISDIHCAVITDLVEHNVPVPGLVDVLFITGTETDSVLGEVIQSCKVDEAIRVLPTLNRYVGTCPPTTSSGSTRSCTFSSPIGFSPIATKTPIHRRSSSTRRPKVWRGTFVRSPKSSQQGYGGGFRELQFHRDRAWLHQGVTTSGRSAHGLHAGGGYEGGHRLVSRYYQGPASPLTQQSRALT